MKTQAQQNYAAERLDPRWQKKRLEILQRDAFKCTECGDEQSTLHVHHRYYVKGRKCWQYPMFAFTSLCEKCHNATHDSEDDDFQITEWESGIALLTSGSNWPHELWQLAELLNVDFKITLKDLIAFLERRAKEGSL